MGQRVHPSLIRQRMKFANRQLSVSYISNNNKLISTNILEDYKIRELASKIFQKHHMTNIIIERVLKNVSVSILLISILTHTSHMLVGPNSSLLDKFRKEVSKMFGVKYQNIEIGITKAENPDTDVEYICRNLVHAIESTNGTNYMRLARSIVEQVNKANDLLGISITISGRINGGTIASNQKLKNGTIKAQSVCADITQSVHPAKTKTGMMGVKVILSRVPVNKKRDAFDEPVQKTYTKAPFNKNNGKFDNKKNSNFKGNDRQKGFNKFNNNRFSNENKVSTNNGGSLNV